jgi:glycerol-3-phosphate dehydrogenase
VSQYLSEPITRGDVKSYWTGIRPLVSDPNASDTAQLARDHVINRNPKSGLITLTGGKWTTYRVMGEHAIDQVMTELGRDPKIEKSKTESLKIVGAEGWLFEDYKMLLGKYEISEDTAIYLHRIYGSQASHLLEMYPKSHGKIMTELPFIWAEVFYSIHYESARSITDVLARRVRMATLDKQATQHVLGEVASIMARELGWSQERLDQELTKARIEFQLSNSTTGN